MEVGLVQSVPPDFNGDLFKDSWLYSNRSDVVAVVVAAANGFPRKRELFKTEKPRAGHAANGRGKEVNGGWVDVTMGGEGKFACNSVLPERHERVLRLDDRTNRIPCFFTWKVSSSSLEKRELRKL